MVRIVGIYASILYICVGALIWGLLVFFIIAPYSFLFCKPSKRYLATRKFISLGIKIYLRSLEILRLIKIVSNNLPNISPHNPKIIVCNHSSLFDILFFIEKYPHCSCVVKPGLARFSPYSILIYFADYLINSKDSNIIEQAILELERGNSIVIFPEGTRLSAKIQTEKNSSQGLLQSFHRGAATLSVRTQVPILPVDISYNPPALGKSFCVSDLPNRLCEISITAHREFHAGQGKEQGILARDLNERLEDHYKKIFLCS